MRQVPPAPQSGLHMLERGVWKAPWQGPDGEIVLLAITSHHRLLVPPSVIAFGRDHIGASDVLWEQLDAQDPVDDASLAALRRRRIHAL